MARRKKKTVSVRVSGSGVTVRTKPKRKKKVGTRAVSAAKAGQLEKFAQREVSKAASKAITRGAARAGTAVVGAGAAAGLGTAATVGAVAVAFGVGYALGKGILAVLKYLSKQERAARLALDFRRARGKLHEKLGRVPNATEIRALGAGFKARLAEIRS